MGNRFRQAKLWTYTARFVFTIILVVLGLGPFFLPNRLITHIEASRTRSGIWSMAYPKNSPKYPPALPLEMCACKGISLSDKNYQCHLDIHNVTVELYDA